MFIDSRTGEAVRSAELHAEPVETQIPASSRRARIVSPLTFSKDMFEVFGSRSTGFDVPFKEALGTRARISPSSLSRKRRIFSIGARSLTNSAAAPVPAI